MRESLRRQAVEVMLHHGAQPSDVAALVMGQRAPTHFTKAIQPSYDEWDIKFLAETTAAAAFPSGAVILVPGTGDTLWEISVDGHTVGSALPFRPQTEPPDSSGARVYFPSFIDLLTLVCHILDLLRKCIPAIRQAVG